MEYLFITLLQLVIIAPIVKCQIVNHLKTKTLIVVFPNTIQREAA
jgi:hypothetical protein